MSFRVLPPALAFALCVPVVGCYAELDGYVPAAAKQECKRQRRCNRSRYDDEHDGKMGRCRDNVEDDLYTAADILERTGWEYEQHAGQDCIAAYKADRTDCSDAADRRITEACADVLADGF